MYANYFLQVNLNPVRIAISLQKSPLICDNLDKIKHILELMSEKEMKRGFETNEIMSFKFHYLSCVVAEIARYLSKKFYFIDGYVSLKLLIDPALKLLQV